MTIYTFLFEGSFNQFGESRLTAPSEEEACSIFYSIDHGAGYGQASKDKVAKLQNLGVAYEFNGDIAAWKEAVKQGEVE